MLKILVLKNQINIVVKNTKKNWSSFLGPRGFFMGFYFKAYEFKKMESIRVLSIIKKNIFIATLQIRLFIDN